MEPDARLIARACHGSKDAFGELVRRHQRPVVALAYRMTGSAAAAEDVAQETFLRTWTHLASLRQAGAFRSWLYRLAVSASIDHLRQSPPALPLLESCAGDNPPPESQALAQERNDAVRQAVLALPHQCRAALILREFEGLSYKEIAHILDIPLGTVMSRLSYARGKLRVALGGYLHPDG